MAPIRKPQVGGGVGKVHRKQRPPKEPSNSWNLFASEEQQSKPKVNNRKGSQPADTERSESPDSVDEAIGPLREMAHRVGEEVERFAETLDEFSLDFASAPSRFDAACHLVDLFQEIAEQKVVELKKGHERELRQALKQEWTAHTRVSTTPGTDRPSSPVMKTSVAARKQEQVQQVQQWQQEVDIWALFKIMLDLHPFDDIAQTRRAETKEKLAKMGKPHRYTSEAELWDRFLMEDDVARERHTIKLWLESTADHQSSDVQGIVEELEAKAGRGKGLWSSGWLHTREKIKGEKRLRTWPSRSESPLPQIRRSDNNELLVTTLDPDAPHRQKRTLEKPDSFLERAMWTACWEMIRRGASFGEVCAWCEERKEGWRAVCMGMAQDSTDCPTSSAAWRHMCSLASRSGCSTEYEAAVFGLLGGNISAIEKVCRNIDDHLHAHYCTTLLHQFDQYVASVCPQKALPSAWSRNMGDGAVQTEEAEQAISSLIQRLRRSSPTSAESIQPMKIIQSFLLADQVGSLIHTVGVAIAQTASLQGPEDMIYLGSHGHDQNEEPMPDAQVALNPQTLRIVAHMSIVHRTLSPGYLQGAELDEDDNVLVAYIQALREARKRSIIPTYASKLKRERAIVAMGRILQDITDQQEQRGMINLLGDHDLDVKAILIEQNAWVVEHNLEHDYAEQPLRILEHTDETKLHPGQRIIIDFLPDIVSAEDDAIVRSLQWFQLMSGHWRVTFEALTLALRQCLVTGRFACARMIIQTFPYEEVSLRKSYETTGRAVNLFSDTALKPADEHENMAWEVMKRQSRTYFELEELIQAVESLHLWRTEEHNYISKMPRPSGTPSTLRRAKEGVSTAMAPLLEGILLAPVDDHEAADLMHIRCTYLPEILIAYNTVLHSAANYISRDALIDSMDLSTIIARDQLGKITASSNGLAECFVKAGRMRELIRSFALSSKAMLVLKAEGKTWKPKREREGKELGMWEIGNVGGRDGQPTQ